MNFCPRCGTRGIADGSFCCSCGIDFRQIPSKLATPRRPRRTIGLGVWAGRHRLSRVRPSVRVAHTSPTAPPTR